MKRLALFCLSNRQLCLQAGKPSVLTIPTGCHCQGPFCLVQAEQIAQKVSWAGATILQKLSDDRLRAHATHFGGKKLSSSLSLLVTANPFLHGVKPPQAQVSPAPVIQEGEKRKILADWFRIYKD